MESFRSSSISPKCTSHLGIGLGRTTSFTPVGIPDTLETPLEPSTPVGTNRWDRRGGLTGAPSADGTYQIGTFGNDGRLWVNDTDADGRSFAAFEVGQTLAMVFTNGYSVTVTVLTVYRWSGFGGQSAGPACTFTPYIDTAQLDLGSFDTLPVGVTITITA